MRRFFLHMLVASALSVLTFPALSHAVTIGDYAAGASANGIAGSRHNLGDFGAYIVTHSTTEICVFCHTPHHGVATTGPLWNKVGSIAPGSFNSYGTTIAGTSVGVPGGATLACLSCHDGATTFDTLVNAPGKGNGGSNNKTATDFDWTFYEYKGGGKLKPRQDVMNISMARMGSNLTDDHPVSVPYIVGRASLRPTTDDIASIDLTTGLATTNDNISQNRWSIGGSVAGLGDAVVADLLRAGRVECSSCHDPHFSNKSFDEVESTWGGESSSDGLFLRRVGGNTGSEVIPLFPKRGRVHGNRADTGGGAGCRQRRSPGQPGARDRFEIKGVVAGRRQPIFGGPCAWAVGDDRGERRAGGFAMAVIFAGPTGVSLPDRFFIG
jgi:hypothetical protein